MGMGVLDTVMAGRLSPVDLAGVALGGSVLFPVMIVIGATMFFEVGLFPMTTVLAGGSSSFFEKSAKLPPAA